MTTSTPTAPQKRLCFIIGPMSDMSRLHRLAYKVVEPLLVGEGFYVETPDHAEIGNIMKQVLFSLDQADLLVADLTGNNPNVLYELGIYHCFGKPYVVVKEEQKGHPDESTPFDVAAYRYTAINLSDLEHAQNQLQPILTNLLRGKRRQTWYSNPVTDFYQSPITQIPSASGLVKNYVRNFLALIIPDIFLRGEDGTSYKLRLRVNGEEVPPALRKTLRLEILVPEDLDQTSHFFIDQMKDQDLLFEAAIPRKSRPFTLYARPGLDEGCCLIDIPTVLSSLDESLAQRLDRPKLRQEGKIDHEWEKLEHAELQRFADALDQTVAEIKDRYFLPPESVSVVRKL